MSIAIASMTAPSTNYTVSLDAAGVWSCTCPSWKFSKKPIQHRACKHLRAINELLGLQIEASQN